MGKKKKTNQKKCVRFETPVTTGETENGLSKNQLEDYTKAVKSYNKAKYQFYHAESLKIHKGWSVPELFVKLKDIRLSGKLLNKYGIRFIDNDIYTKQCFSEGNTDSRGKLNLRKRHHDTKKHEEEIKKPRSKYPTRKSVEIKVENCTDIKVKSKAIKTEIQPKPKSKPLKKPSKQLFKPTSKKKHKKPIQKVSDTSKTIKNINLSLAQQQFCAECSLVISSSHFSVKKLYCNLCNFNTFCSQAFQLHKQHIHKSLHGFPVLSELNSLPHKQACVFLSIGHTYKQDAIIGEFINSSNNDNSCNNDNDKITSESNINDNDTDFNDNSDNINKDNITENDRDVKSSSSNNKKRCCKETVFYCFCGFVTSTSTVITNHIASCTLHCRIYRQIMVSPTSASHTHFLNLNQSPINEGFMIPPDELSISTSNLPFSPNNPTTIASDIIEDLLDNMFSIEDNVVDIISKMLNNVEETLMLREHAMEHSKRREKRLKMKERIDAYRLTRPVLRSAMSSRRHKESIEKVEEQPNTDLLLKAIGLTLDTEDLVAPGSASTAVQPREESDVYKDTSRSGISMENDDLLNQKVDKAPCISLDGQYELFQQKLKKQQEEIDLKLQQQRQEHQQHVQQRKKDAQQDIVEQIDDQGQQLPQLSSQNQAAVEQQGYTEVELLQNIHYQLSQSQNDDSTSFTQPSSFAFTNNNPINQNSNMNSFDDRSQAIIDAGVLMYDKANGSTSVNNGHMNNDKIPFGDTNTLSISNLTTHINPYNYPNNPLFSYYNTNNVINTNIMQHNQAVTLPK